MSFYQLAVFDYEAYVLLSDGTIKQYVRDGHANWKVIITKNAENAQIAAGQAIGIRQRNGNVFKLDGTVKPFGTNATKLWASKDGFWQWQQGSGRLYYEGSATGGKWVVYDTNPLVKDLVSMEGVSTFQLLENGTITNYQGPNNWKTIGASAHNTMITTDKKSLYTLDGSQIEIWDGSSWTTIDRNASTVQIAAGEAGVFQRHRSGQIWKYTGTGQSWTRVDGGTTENPDNIQIAVAGAAYRVNSKGEIYIYRDNAVWDRIKEEDPHPSPPNPFGIAPEKIYDGGFTNSSQILLRIGNGGAGQTGLVEVLANAYIKSKVNRGSQPFKVAWYKSDTTESINYLKNGTVDVGITYTKAAEDIAIEQGIALSTHYIFREHFLLTGPPSNPAKLDPNADIFHQISTLYAAAETGNTTPPVRFLSRYDKSATSIKDSELWIQIGQVPWAMRYSNWYHQFMAYPIQALTAAAALEEYTLTDWGTYLSVDESVRKQVTVFKHGQDDVKDALLMPAHLLVGAKALDLPLAKDFAAWATSKEGQDVIAGFKKGDQQVYSTAPTS
ncbi:hypothetical protein BJX70DRAFT_357319 [Aspergillus crustosus]